MWDCYGMILINHTNEGTCDMKKKTIIADIIVPVVVALIGVAAGGGGYYFGKQSIINQVENAMANVIGDNATVTINDIGNFLKDYEDIKDENEGLRTLNNQYVKQLDRYDMQLNEQNKSMQEYQEQLSGTPIFEFKDIHLVIDGEDISVNSNKSMVTIDGRDYVSKDIMEKLVPENQNVTVKDDTIYIGKVIADKANLIDKWVIDEHYYEVKNTITDSYGNTHTNCILLNGGVYFYGDVTYNVLSQYSMLKAVLSVGAGTSSNANVSFCIEADDQVVYSYDNLNIHTQPIQIEVPINNCTELKFSFSGAQFFNCTISDAIVYNE